MRPARLAVTDAEWAIIADILRTYVPHCVVRVFGSRVTETARPFSDLDVAVGSDESIDNATLANLREALAESDLPFKVDVVDWVTTSARFRAIIEREAIEIGERS